MRRPVNNSPNYKPIVYNCNAVFPGKLGFYWNILLSHFKQQYKRNCSFEKYSCSLYGAVVALSASVE